MKPKLLFSNEVSYLQTGFSKIGREILNYLYKDGSLDIVEIGSYGVEGDPRLNDYPWKIYPVVPRPGTPEHERYKATHQQAQFGASKFTYVVVQEKPDIVFDMRDYWMIQHILQNPYRDFFRLAIRPTVDGAPQREEWIKGFETADLVFSHSRWGKDILESQSQRIKVCDVLPGGFDDKTYNVINDKRGLREKYRLSPDLKIILTVCRNQPRKQFPELFEAYAMLKKRYPDTFRHSVLLCHTSYPDPMGWELPELLRRFNLLSDVIFTNICQSCGSVFFSPIQQYFEESYKNVCWECDKVAGVFPNTANGVSESTLNEIYNLADLYVQLASGEGFGIPMVEAKAVGVPVMACPYSAMVDHVEDPGGISVKVKGHYYDFPSMQKRAIPDLDDLVERIRWFFGLSKEERKKIGREGMEYVRAHYTYNDVSRIFLSNIMSINLLNREETWDSPKRLLTNYKSFNGQSIPDHATLTNKKFVERAYSIILERASAATSVVDEYTKLLNSGKMNRDMVVGQFLYIANQLNKFEELRTSGQGKLTDSTGNPIGNSIDGSTGVIELG